MAAQREHTTAEIYLRLLRQARPRWMLVAGVLAIGLASVPLALLTPVPLKIVIDHVLAARPLPAWFERLLPGGAASPELVLGAAALLIVLVAVANLLRAAAGQLLGTYAGERLVLDARAQLLRHAQRLSLSYHDARGTADSIYRIQYDAAAIQWIAIDGLVPFITAAVTVLAMLAVTAKVNGVLALIAAAVCPALLVLTHLYGGRLRDRWHAAKKLESATMAVVQEGLSAVRVVKAFGREAHEHERFVAHGGRNLGAKLRVALDENVYGLLVGLTTAAGTAAVMYVGARAVRAGDITPGDLLLVLAYLAQLYAPLRTMSSQVGAQQRSLASAERVFALLDEAPDVHEHPHARPLSRARGSVSFRDVVFAYPPGTNPVLDGVTFDVPSGSRVGIAGRTGAGKTTLTNLLCRFYDPQAGNVLLDGVNLRDYRLADLRAQFGIVLQEPVLFSTTIAENIAYARPGAAEQEIIEAARAADAHEFICGLPDGYATQVGERGMRLSGGERQRISLARAFLKDAPILILDEPTSSVDAKTEASIMDAMRRLMSGRTTFMIAHRLGTLDHCDLRLHVEAGRVTVASGAEPAPARETGVAETVVAGPRTLLT